MHTARTFLILLALASAARAGWGQPDARQDFEASVYVGLGVDTFATQSQRDVLYGSAQDNAARRERFIGGVNVARRLRGTNTDARKQLWVFGSTRHGVRTAEVDCTNAATRSSICDLTDSVIHPSAALAPGQQLLYLLHNASTLEAHAGLRYEFLTLHAAGMHPAKLFLSAQAGFLNVAQSGGDAYDDHRVSVGVVNTNGPFQGSQFELGYGRNDVFLTNRRRRAVVDGYLLFGPAVLRSAGVFCFLQMTTSTDLGPGADSMQTFFGLRFDLNRLLQP